MDRSEKIAESRRLDKAIRRAEQRRREERAGRTDPVTGERRGTTDKSAVLGRAPAARTGESIMSSRGYQYSRLAGLLLKELRPEDCKIELECHEKLLNAMHGAGGWRPAKQSSIVAPLEPAYLMGAKNGFVDDRFGMTLKDLMWGGTSGFDPDEAGWLTRKHGVVDTTKGYVPDTQKVGGSTQSWMQQSLGGALIPFPEMGPLIPLLRNKNAVMTAGATVLPLPPQGRLAFPRQTAPTLGYHVGEGTKITQSSVNTDQLLLSAKKIGAYVITNNELIRFGGPVVEQLFRNDMTITLGLTLDYDILQSEGSDNVTAGLIGYPGVQSFTASNPATNGDSIGPADIYTFISKVQAANASFEAFVLRPELFWAMVSVRAGVYNGSTTVQQGQFVFDVIRKMSENDFDRIAGYKAVTSANVPLNRVKGTGTNLTTCYGGMWSDLKIGIFGTIEFATADQGDNIFPQDQTAIRAVLSADAGPQHPGAFCYVDTLLSGSAGP